MKDDGFVSQQIIAKRQISQTRSVFGRCKRQDYLDSIGVNMYVHIIYLRDII